MNVTILVDNRERAVIPFLEEIYRNSRKLASVRFETRQLEVGDYVILNNDTVLACIERKTLTDFAASFAGRYSSQKKKMFDFRDKTRCKLFYMVEGVAFPPLDKKFNHIPYRNILAAITSMMVRDSVFVVQTKDQMHTAERLYDLALIYVAKVLMPAKNPASRSNCTNGTTEEIPEGTAGEKEKNLSADIAGGSAVIAEKPAVEEERVSGADEVSGADRAGGEDEASGEDRASEKGSVDGDIVVGFSEFKSEGKTLDDMIIKMWSSLSGISVVGAASIGSVCTLEEFFGDEYDTAMEVQTAKNRSLTKVAKNSLERLRKSEPEVSKKFLSNCPGIGKQTAENMLNEYKLREIVGLPVKDLAECRISGKRFGERRAEKLRAVFVGKVAPGAVEKIQPTIERRTAKQARRYARRNQCFRGKRG